jgi:hypothetical protein
MPRRTRRPMSPLLITMGSLALLGGVLGLLCGTCGMGVTALALTSGAGPNAAYFRHMDREAPLWRVVEIGKPLILTLLSFVILPAGVGLLMRKSWGRWLAVAYALAIIPLHIVHAIYEFAAVLPATRRFDAGALGSGAGPFAGNQAGAAGGLVIGAVLWIMLALALIIGLLNPIAGRDLAPYDPREDEERRIRELEEEEEDEERRRRRKPKIDDLYR